MEEILPTIRDTWISLSKKYNIEISVFNIDSTDVKSYLPKIIQSDLIVLTSFNAKMAFIINLIRSNFEVDTKFVFYLHGLATIGLWPLKRFHALDCLSTNDLFIGTCEGDYKCLKEALINFNYFKSYFPYIEKPKLITKESNQRRLVYIGRISPQKNLHHLIQIYSQMQISDKEILPLIIYGKEDNLGHPNIGLSNNDYLNFLQKLVNSLNLSNYVQFKGFVERELIDIELNKNDIIISLSTHSDENFGMVIYKYLLKGLRVIITKWGGHNNYSHLNCEMISYVNVTFNNENIPIPDYESALNQIVKCIYSKNKDEDKFIDLFNFQEHLDQLYEAISSHIDPKVPLAFTPTGESIFQNQQISEMRGNIQQCFKDTSDQNYLKLIRCYY